MPGPSQDTLDPQDWQALREQGHRMLDDMLDYLQDLRRRPVWQPIPPQLLDSFRQALPQQPADLAAVHGAFMQDILPDAIGNAHPGFMGWVQGGGTPVGMLAEMLAAGINANVGGRDQMPVEHAAVDQLLRHRLIARDLHEVSLTELVIARVTDLQQIAPRPDADK